jgi:hypothetical protein
MAQISELILIVPPEILATGVTLVPATHPSVASSLNAIAGEEIAVIQKLLPYAVILANGSSKRLLATSVSFEWANAKGEHRGRYFVLTTYDGLYAIEPGQTRLFLLQRGLNTHFAKPSTARGAMQPDYAPLIDSIVGDLAGASSIKASVAGVLFEDFLFLGAEQVFRSLQADRPEIHRR